MQEYISIKCGVAKLIVILFIIIVVIMVIIHLPGFNWHLESSTSDELNQNKLFGII